MTEEPSLGEIGRGLDRVQSQLAALIKEIREDRIAAEGKYVTNQVYDRDLNEVRRDVTELKEDAAAKERRVADFRRQMFVALAVPLILALAGFLLAVNNYIAGGGQTP